MNAPDPIPPTVQTLRVSLIAASPTNPRKHFDKTSLDELTESIRRHGVLQPILVRPNRDRERFEEYEIISGERRWRAAQAAELREIPALVRDLGDAETLEIQVVENLQRADLHPLEEAEGYEALHQTHGYSVEDLAAKVGKSVSYVRARMRLTALCEAARAEFYAGKLSPSTALLVARIPDHGLQMQATAEIIDPYHYGAPMTTAEASDHIQQMYMLRLATAPFKPSDADLLPDAGPCTTCPKRTGNAGELFDDIKGPDTCTDPTCFERKKIAHKDRLIEKARAKGSKVIDGEAAKKLMPNSFSKPKGYVSLETREYRVDGGKTVRQLVAKAADVERVVIVNPHTHEVIEAVPEKAYADVLVVAGVTNTSVAQSDAAKKEKAKTALDKAWRLALFGALRAPRALDLEDQRLIAKAMFGHLTHDLAERIRDVWSWPKVSRDDSGIDELNGEQLDRLMIDMALVAELQTWSYSTAKPVRMLALAERLSIDADAIKRELAGEQKAKTKAKKPAAKKVATKKASKPPKTAAASAARKAAKTADAAPNPADSWPFPTKP